jgi:hypothetical protein
MQLAEAYRRLAGWSEERQAAAFPSCKWAGWVVYGQGLVCERWPVTPLACLILLGLLDGVRGDDGLADALGRVVEAIREGRVDWPAVQRQEEQLIYLGAHALARN